MGDSGLGILVGAQGACGKRPTGRGSGLGVFCSCARGGRQSRPAKHKQTRLYGASVSASGMLRFLGESREALDAEIEIKSAREVNHQYEGVP